MAHKSVDQGDSPLTAPFRDGGGPFFASVPGWRASAESCLYRRGPSSREAAAERRAGQGSGGGVFVGIVHFLGLLWHRRCRPPGKVVGASRGLALRASPGVGPLLECLWWGAARAVIQNVLGVCAMPTPWGYTGTTGRMERPGLGVGPPTAPAAQGGLAILRCSGFSLRMPQMQSQVLAGEGTGRLLRRGEAL